MTTRHDSMPTQAHWARWREHFERHQRRPLPSLSGAGGGLPREVRAELARSLAVFQIGETGEGRIVRELRANPVAGIDEDYLRALELFVAEEGRHARILGDALRALGGRAASSHWSADVFRRVRRAGGTHVELVVLLAAEIAALVLYAGLARALDAGSPLGAALAEIAHDEREHLEFHLDFFASRSAPVRVASGIAVGGLGVAAGVAALVGHGSTVAAVGGSSRDLAVEFGQVIARAVARCLPTFPYTRRGRQRANIPPPLDGRLKPSRIFVRRLESP